MWTEFARLPNALDTRFPLPIRPESVIIRMVLEQTQTQKDQGNAEEDPTAASCHLGQGLRGVQAATIVSRSDAMIWLHTAGLTLKAS
jgi:hypothetical protein